MKLRVKMTNYWGEVISSDVISTQLEMPDGSVQIFRSNELTNKTITNVAEDFVWSIFAKDGSRKNQFIFFGVIIIIGIIIGIII